MRRTACTHIISWHCHYSDLSFNLDFTSVLQLRKLIPWRICHLYRNIFWNGYIYLMLHLCYILRWNHSTEIHCHYRITQMKAHIFKSKSAVDNSRKNVLSTVLLHIIKTMLPVYFTLYMDSCCKLSFLRSALHTYNLFISLLFCLNLFFPHYAAITCGNIHRMSNDSILNLHINDPVATKYSHVRALSALLREK